MTRARITDSGNKAGRPDFADVDYLLSHFPGAVSVYDDQLRLIAANDQHFELTGLSRERFGIGSTYEDITRHIAETGGYGADVDIDATVAHRLEAVRQPHWKFERMERGRHIAGYTATTPAGGVICCQQDITEEKETEQRLIALTRELIAARDEAEAAARAKSEFLAMMSHEIRTPLNGILGMSEIMLARADDPIQKTHLDVVLKSGQALLSIINDVLDLARIDAGRLRLETAPFDLRQLAEDVATLLASRLDGNAVDMALRMDPRLPSMMFGDGDRVRQILMNLIGNAVKFTQTGHIAIDIDGATDGAVAHLCISVRDTGIGISPEHQETIFERFEQADIGSRRRYGGAGLGLAICRLLAEGMGGQIGVESEPGRGSRFWFTLSLPVAEVQPEAESPDLSGLQVLVLDACAPSRDALTELLTHYGATVETSPAALDRTDLAFIDPRAVKPEHLPRNGPPLVGLRPVASGKSADQSIFTACVLKPVRRADLAEAIQTVLATPSIRAAS